MKPETDPVSPEELVIRLVWKFHFKQGMPLTVKTSAFAPRQDENDGISVFRMACVANPEDALSAIDPAKRDGYGIVLLEVDDLRRLGLRVRSAPISEVPGHCVIPELSDANATGDLAWKTLLKELARLANRRIVRYPKP